MSACLKITLIAGLVLGGLPHAFCFCARTEPSAATAAGHGCCTGHDDPAAEHPDSCQCRICDAVKAVGGTPKTSAPSLDLTSRVAPAADASSVRFVSVGLPEDFSPGEPSGWLAHSGCALPILLGHLLL